MINRNNYEEYFLMYVDGELPVQEQQEVLKFLAEHPEFKAEFEEIKMTKLIPEHMHFAGKENLLQGKIKIDATNYTSWFLSAIDNELTEAESLQVEAFLEANPAYREEFSILSKMVLPMETIVFAEKNSLLKKEKVRQLTPAFFRIAAAASVLAVAVLLWQSRPAKPGNTVVTHPSNEVAVSKQQPMAPAKEETQIAQAVTRPEPVKGEKAHPKVSYAFNQTSDREKAEIKRNEIASEPVIATIEPPKPDIRTVPNEIKPNPEDLIAASRPKRSEPARNVSEDESGLNMPDHPASLYSTTNYKVIDTKSETDESLYIGGLEINKNKVRGIFKKIGSAFNTKSNNESSGDEVRIANFQIQKNQ